MLSIWNLNIEQRRVYLVQQIIIQVSHQPIEISKKERIHLAVRADKREGAD